MNKDKINSIREDINKALNKVLSSSIVSKSTLTEGSSGTPSKITDIRPSEERSKMVELYDRLTKELDEDQFNIEFNQDSITISVAKDFPSSFDYTPYMSSLIGHMVSEGLKIVPLPEIKIRKDIKESANFFGKTAYYDPTNREIVLYVLSRHPKDIMRSFSHELIHHMQNLENRLQNITTQNVNEDNDLMKLEEEAYLLGNKMFRSWENSKKFNQYE